MKANEAAEDRAAGAISDAEVAAFDLLAQPVWVLDRQRRLVHVNRQSRRRTPVAFGDQAAVVHPDDATPLREAFDVAERWGGEIKAEVRLKVSSEGYRWHLVQGAAQRHDETVVRWVGTATDLDRRVREANDLSEMVRVRDEMLDVSIDCIKIIDTDGTLQHMNRSGCVALGVSDEQAAAGFGMDWLGLLPEEVRGPGEEALASARSGHNARFPGMSALEGGPVQHWDNVLTPAVGPDGVTTAILCMSRDVTGEREAERRLRHAVEHDSLTGLLNRRAFTAGLEDAVSDASARATEVGLIVIDLDHFKAVNATFGHPAGDHLLHVLGERISDCVPENSLVGRLGGDEFAVVLPEADEPTVRGVAAAVLRQADTPVAYDGRLISSAMSVGYALFPGDADDTVSLMRRSDAALNDIKAGGRGGVRTFHRSMLTAGAQAATQLVQARLVIDHAAVMPHYQRIERLADGALHGVEALLRWTDQNGNVHGPDSLAEAFGDFELATALASQMHELVFADMARWRDQGLEVPTVAINVAAAEFLRDDFGETVLARLARHGLDPARLGVEVTEQAFLDRGADLAVRALRMLKDAGVTVTLDDFGTGSASFAQIRDHRVDSVKIDLSFVARMVDEPPILAMVQALAGLGSALSVGVVAEGVETESQRELLQQHGYRLGQGHLLSPPVDGATFAAALARP